MGMYEHVELTRDGGVVELRFHTGGGPLVWSATAHAELPRAFAALDGDRDTSVVILTGTGPEFCTRLDRLSFAGVDGGWDTIWWEGRRLLRSLVAIDVPVIAAINGPATIHTEIPALADIVLAADTAVIADHAHLVADVLPSDAAHVVWPHLLGPTRANYFLLTGQELSAHEAQALGVVNEVLPADAVLARAWELARDLARRPRAVLRYTRDGLAVRRRELIGQALGQGPAVEALGVAASVAAPAGPLAVQRAA